MRPGASPSRPRAPKAPKIEISSIFLRFSIDFSRVFPHCVQLSGCVKRFFFARLTAFDQQNAKKKSAAIAFVLRFAARHCSCDFHNPTHNLRATQEDRKYGYFWIFPHHSCENIQKYFEFLDTFGYSPIISEQLSDVLGGRSPP